MSTRKPSATRLEFCAVVGVAVLLLAVPPTDAKAITFGQWAAGRWPGNIAPAEVKARSASIDSLVGIGNYNWNSTPTTVLSLAGNEIASLGTADFTGLENLMVLDLSCNPITNIESGHFIGLENLNSLYLEGCEITSIMCGDFTGLDNLKYLFLGGQGMPNRITSIEAGDFTGMNNLTYLSLSCNQITSIESHGLAELENMKTVDLSCNYISSIESGDFAELANLTELNLMVNEITSIESGAFAGLPNLRMLNLGDNRALTGLNLDEAGFLNLTQVDLLGNVAITHVSLRHAQLSQTALAALIDGGNEYPWFIGIGELPGITELDLSGVDFAAITDLSPLYMMDSLTDLWLADALNMDADQLDVLLDNMATMQDQNTEGVLYLTKADYNAWNAAGGGKLAAWDAELGHHVQIVPEPGAWALLAASVLALGLFRLRRSGFPA